jgi:hypothetical protein
VEEPVVETFDWGWRDIPHGCIAAVLQGLHRLAEIVFVNTECAAELVEKSDIVMINALVYPYFHEHRRGATCKRWRM